MNTPLSWIKAYVPELECTDQEYMDAMTLSGTKCEGFERLDADLDKIVVGQIEKIEKHPDADKLVICQVNIEQKQFRLLQEHQMWKGGRFLSYWMGTCCRRA
ncbi:MAG: hypothetical protein ACLR1A_01785 [Eubacterium ventriosum]